MKRFILIIISLLPCCAFAQKGLTIQHLSGNLYTYVTWHENDGEQYPATGMYLVTGKGAVIIDTPWDTTQIRPLNDSILLRHHQPVLMVIATHHHGDRAGGFDVYKRMGIKTYSTQLTYELCEEYKEPKAAYTFRKDTTFNIGGYKFQAFYPGKGHTKDNIVIWFGRDKVLFGGCFVKSLETEEIGYIKEASLADWPASIERVKKAFPDARYVIPGHLGGTNPAALDHTSELAKHAH
ncbi:BlaB/IND/MUS family subclass B1 metallo-beta-lactamase [Chitinophaga sp.]|uniref:BlaB/IND/MUS family subclass B1 metallo-beta-lactamase n=1 Tax=Chitinophaga sp. TaxID=1869181 RepID=UPI0031E09B72